MASRTTMVATFLAAMLFAPMHGQVSGGASQSGSLQSGNSAASVGSMQNVQASLSKALSVKNAKVGDEVFARTTADFMANGLKVPRGSRLAGHITEAQARSKGNPESKLGILFDRVEPRGGGQPIPVALHIAGVGAPVASSASSSAYDDADMNATVAAPQASAGMNASARTSAGSGLLSGVGSTVGGVTRGAGAATGTAVDTAAGALRTTGSSARSAVTSAGSTMNGIALRGSGTTDAVLTSTARDVQLQSGTSLMLTGTGSAQ